MFRRRDRIAERRVHHDDALGGCRPLAELSSAAAPRIDSALAAWSYVDADDEEQSPFEDNADDLAVALFEDDWQ
jgi:hypothetical protein